MSNLTFALDKSNVSQGQVRCSLPGLRYLDVCVEADGEYQCSLSGWVSNEITALVLAAPELREVLRAIVHEYEQTVEGDCVDGHWTAAASIPVETMERAKALIAKL